MYLSALQIIERLSRASLVELLESVSIQCYDSETDDVLREAVRVNYDDCTIPAEAIQTIWKSNQEESSGATSEEEPQLYEIVRFFQRGGREVIATDKTLEEAEEHCSDDESSSETCTTESGQALTRERGAWFDGRRKI